MAKYMTLFTYTGEASARMVQNPGDRSATVRRLADSLGGSVECLYWGLGSYDGIVILDLPDSISAASLSVTVGSTGAFKNLETHELLTKSNSARRCHDPRTRRTHTSHPGSNAFGNLSSGLTGVLAAVAGERH